MEKMVTCVLLRTPEVEKWTKQIWLDHLERESEMKILSIARTPTVSFSTWVLFHGHSGGNMIHLQDKKGNSIQLD